MNTASLELCKELYELSGWEAETATYLTPDGKEYFGGLIDGCTKVPRYDLGYLIRKLPANIDFNDEIVKLTLDRQSEKVWRASYAYPVERMKAKRKYADWKFKATQADTPEDAACKLAIELFKQGVLGK